MVIYKVYSNVLQEISILEDRLRLIKDRITVGETKYGNNAVKYLADKGRRIGKYQQTAYEEKESLEEELKKLYNCQNNMNKALQKLTGISQQLYREIQVNGLNVTKAVEKVANDNDMQVNAIWQNYYKKIKPYLIVNDSE